MRLSLALAAGMLAAALGGPSAAQPSDTTPDPGFAGVWRVVHAAPAPWITPHALTEGEAPLLSHQVRFAKEEVDGPPSPLSCRHARYSARVVPPQGLFQGKLPAKNARRIAQALGFDTLEVTTLRVDCDTGSFDYHLDHDGRLLFALNNVVFTMDHLEASDAKPGWNGPSFACLNPATGGEKTICADPDLAKADRAIAEAYGRLKRTETAESFATVERAERGWLGYVMSSCKADAPFPADQQGRDSLNGCLSGEYQGRAERLSGAAATRGPGGLVLEPRMGFLVRRRPDISESDNYPWMSGGPQAASFNAFIRMTLKLGTARMDDKDLFAFGNDIPEGMKLFARRDYSVALRCPCRKRPDRDLRLYRRRS